MAVSVLLLHCTGRVFVDKHNNSQSQDSGLKSLEFKLFFVQHTMNNTITLPATFPEIVAYLETPMPPPIIGQPTVADGSKAALISAGVKFARMAEEVLTEQNVTDAVTYEKQVCGYLLKVYFLIIILLRSWRHIWLPLEFSQLSTILSSPPETRLLKSEIP
jgi:hypothetical protein